MDIFLCQYKMLLCCFYYFFKTSVPVPSPVHGVIEKRLVEDGATVKAGQDLCTITITGRDNF
jgi:hypothetical protein